MRFEASCRVNTSADINTVAESVRQRFATIARSVAVRKGLITAHGIETSFGSVNRTDHVGITIDPREGGYLINATVTYQPSFMFWVFILIGLFTWVLWILPIVFYLTQKTSVRTAVEKALDRVKNEFDQVIVAPVVIPAASPSNSTVTAIQEAKALFDDGTISEAEFQAMKSKILAVG
jgi:hypothetical protein